MARQRDDIDQSKEARTPTYKHRDALGATTIMRVVDMRLRFPEATITEIAEMTGINRHSVGAALSTQMARARIDSAYDVRPLVQQKLREQALNAFEVLSKVQLKALENFENGEAIDAALLSAATRTSLETLKGVGILKDHNIEETKVLDGQEVSQLLDKADNIRAALEGKLKEKLEDVAEAQVVDTEELREEPSED